MEEKYIKALQEIAKVLSNESRLKIILELLKAQENKYCIADFSKLLNKDVSVVYRHIKELEKVNIVELRKKGKYFEVCLKDPEKVKKLIKCMLEIYVSHLDQPQTKQV